MTKERRYMYAIFEMDTAKCLVYPARELPTYDGHANNLDSNIDI